MPRRTVGSEDRDFSEHLKDKLDLDFFIDYSWVLEWVAGNFSPEDVFDRATLEKWAEDNGFVLEEGV